MFYQLQRKKVLMMALLGPVIEDFNGVYNKLSEESDSARQQAYAECLNCAMSFARLVYDFDKLLLQEPILLGCLPLTAYYNNSNNNGYQSVMTMTPS